MFRYRCPHCTKLLQAPELRAGKTTVCSKCSQPLTIPGDKTEWLNERGEPLLASPTVVIKTPPPVSALAPQAVPDPRVEPDNDVLGAICSGEFEPAHGASSGAFPIDVGTPGGMSAALSALLGQSDVALTPAPPPPAPRPPVEAPPPPAARVDVPVPPPVEPAPERTRVPTPLPRSLPRRTLPVDAAPTPPPRGAGEPAARPAPARTRRLVATVPTPTRRGDDGMVALADPVRVRNQLDFAVDLTSALTSRMKPPPRPPRDLKPSTAVWMLATGVALALLLATLVTHADHAETVAVIGAAEVVVGYLWIVRLAALRDWRRGVACAAPPLTFWYLGQWKYAKLRPLRFVATGGLLLLLAAGAAYALPHTRAWAGVPDTSGPRVIPPDIAAQSKLDQLRYFREQRSYEALVVLLRTLARTDPGYSDEAKNRIEIAAELKGLCDHRDADVKVEAMAAYANWGQDDARRVCLEATRSTNQEERLMALRLLPRWKDDRVAQAIASRIGRSGTETSVAQDALIELGGPLAERATIPLLQDSREQGVRLTAIEILGHEKVGGPEAVARLIEVSKTSADPGTRHPAEKKAAAIQARLKK